MKEEVRLLISDLRIAVSSHDCFIHMDANLSKMNICLSLLRFVGLHTMVNTSTSLALNKVTLHISAIVGCTSMMDIKPIP